MEALTGQVSAQHRWLNGEHGFFRCVQGPYYFLKRPVPIEDRTRSPHIFPCLKKTSRGAFYMAMYIPPKVKRGKSRKGLNMTMLDSINKPIASNTLPEDPLACSSRLWGRVPIGFPSCCVTK